jgi:hypothetical protein
MSGSKFKQNYRKSGKAVLIILLTAIAFIYTAKYLVNNAIAEVLNPAQINKQKSLQALPPNVERIVKFPKIQSVSPARITIGDTVVVTGLLLNQAEADVSINKFNQTSFFIKISNNSSASDGPNGLYTPGSFIKIYNPNNPAQPWEVSADGKTLKFRITGISAYNPYHTLWSRSFSFAPAAQGGDRQDCDPGDTYVPSWVTPETVTGKLRLRARSLGNTMQNFWPLASPSVVEVYSVKSCHPGVTRCMNDLPCGWAMCQTMRCN